MTDPQRLIDEGDASPLARSLLTAGRARRDPEGSRERVWTGLAAGIAVGVVTTPASAAGKAGVAASLGKAKLLLGVALSIGVGASVAIVHSRMDSAPPPPQVAGIATAPTTLPRAIASPAEAAEVTPSSLPDALPATRVATSPSKPTAAPPSQSPSTNAADLRDETALLREARAALTRGDVATTSSKIDEARRRFPNSQLAQERDALEIRVASDGGDRARAAALARVFVSRYPDSPLRPAIEGIATSDQEKE